ncbi:Arc family DNA-binding protein [Xanthomonas campestris]|uniref:Arc family DNA-binding protein n=1 Tax=Xanthomonas campestris TaxID=339 RepID=UPI0023680052|nr:Arc family DNA-binding protein [Xanthomonas campestris]WDI91918.1 Arc family DNA-binding protein [Xanthomonas campestris]
MRTDEQINVRIPVDLREWLRTERDKNRSSLTSEVVRALRERKERAEQKEAA